jgi:hypothetical protein
VINPGWYKLGENAALEVTRRPFDGQILNEASLQFFSNDPAQPAPAEPHKIWLPDGYDTWVAAWARGGTVVWVQEKDGIRRYDVSAPEKVKAEAVEADKVPADIREAIRAALPAFAAQLAPKRGPRAAAAGKP